MNLTLHVMSLHFDFLPGKSSLHLNEIVLLLQADSLLLTDLLLAILGLVVVLFAHPVQVVFH